jgi:hypothetical protein
VRLRLTPTALALTWLVGCSGERVAECDALLSTVQRVADCPKLERAQRVQIDQAGRTIKDAIDRLEAVGTGRAPADVVNEAKRTCLKQDAEIRQLYEKVAPECLR